MVKKIFIVFLIGILLFIPTIQVYATPPSDGDTKTTKKTLDEVVTGADGFLEVGKEKGDSLLNEAKIQDFSSLAYNTLAIIGTVIAVIIGSILGWQIMTGGVEEKSQAKEKLIPFGIGVVVLAGAFIIWKIVVSVLQ